ncbi:hypothetical protein [Paraburkholderia caballeronis]|nr:hypothetical protein [Paraburkholderia caballeronis]
MVVSIATGSFAGGFPASRQPATRIAGRRGNVHRRHRASRPPTAAIAGDTMNEARHVA